MPGYNTPVMRRQQQGVFYALAAAALFGASTPFAKLLLPDVSPGLLAGLLYLGSGLGLGTYWLLSRRTTTREARLKRPDLPWLLGAVLVGGLLGPLLLMWGLARTPASSASLLLNLEGVFTALLAWFVFKENFDARIALGMGLIVAGGVCLSWSGVAGGGIGLLAVAGACLAWAIDNNLTRKVSAVDPVQIAMIKGLGAGTANVALGLAYGAPWPQPHVLLGAGAIGFLGYGVSLALFVLALRHLGAARTGAYFSTAPFVGAALSIAMLGDRIGLGFIAAALLMGLGVWLHLTERHAHFHRHEATSHEHLHTHDEHHHHTHSPQDPPGEPHSHPHVHDNLTHRHSHYPDLHHRHEH